MRWGVVLALLLAWVGMGRASDDEPTRKTLRGLAGVSVVIEEMRPDAEKYGLTRAQLQTDVELRLRKAGIQVLTEEELQEVPGKQCLYVVVSTLKNDSGLYAYSTHVGLIQRAFTIATGDLCMAETWMATGHIGMVDAANLRSVREYVGDDVDKFINAWLSVNPVKR